VYLVFNILVSSFNEEPESDYDPRTLNVYDSVPSALTRDEKERLFDYLHSLTMRNVNGETGLQHKWFKNSFDFKINIWTFNPASLTWIPIGRASLIIAQDNHQIRLLAFKNDKYHMNVINMRCKSQLLTIVSEHFSSQMETSMTQPKVCLLNSGGQDFRIVSNAKRGTETALPAQGSGYPFTYATMDINSFLERTGQDTATNWALDFQTPSGTCKF
jgi:hypothetical protein